MDDHKSPKGYGMKLDEITTPIRQKGQVEELQVLYPIIVENKKVWEIKLWNLLQTTKVTLSSPGK